MSGIRVRGEVCRETKVHSIYEVMNDKFIVITLSFHLKQWADKRTKTADTKVYTRMAAILPSVFLPKIIKKIR